MDYENLYRIGQREAEVRHGNECRTYDRVLGGLCRVLAAAGIIRTPMELANVFHWPLAGESEERSLAEVRTTLESVLRQGVENAPKYESRYDTSECRLMRLGMRVQREVIEIEAKGMLAAAIKAQKPHLRKNSREYRALFEKNLPQAMLRTRQRHAGEFEREIAQFERLQQRDPDPQLKRLSATATTLRGQSEIVRGLGGSLAVTQAADALTDQLEQLVASKNATVAQGIALAWQTLAGLKGELSANTVAIAVPQEDAGQVRQAI